MKVYAVGIDVQMRRGCPIAVLRPDGSSAAAVWADGPEQARGELIQVLGEEEAEDVVIGIDAPRRPLPGPRAYYWSGSGRTWRPRGSEKGVGRHCEVVISAHGLARPQWTPVQGGAPAWMERGFRLYEALADLGQTCEVFPTASYNQLRERELRVEVELGGFGAGPKDMIDAYVAAVTAREYALGRGEAVGDGDGLGAIILPRPLESRIEEVLRWPGDADGPARGLQVARRK